MPNIKIPQNYQAKPDLLAERVILVTGAGSGIGREAAMQYASLGATVIITGRTTGKLETLYDEIMAKGHIEPVIFPMEMDKATEQDYLGMAGGIENEFGRLDGLLHNAAELGSLTPIDHYPAKLWQDVCNVNLHGPVLLTQACLPLLRRAKQASIIFSSTDDYEKQSAYWGAYAVSKQGIDAFMLVLADELENNTNIRVNAINSGPVRTRLRSQAYPAEDPNTLKIAADIMTAYAFLMGSDCSDIHGKIINAQ